MINDLRDFAFLSVKELMTDLGIPGKHHT